MSVTPAAVEEVRQYRKAARAIVRDERRSYGDRAMALAALADRGRQEAELPDWVGEAIWREARHFIETGRVTDTPSPDPVIGRARQLLAQGYADAPAAPGHCRTTFNSSDGRP